MGKNDLKYMSEEFNNNVLDLDKEKVFYPYEYMKNTIRNVRKLVTNLVDKKSRFLIMKTYKFM